MDEDREKLSQPAAASAEPKSESTRGLPEEASEIYELVEEAGTRLPEPAPPPRPALVPTPMTPEYPEEALNEIRALRAKLENKDRQIEQVMEAYRGKKEETEKTRKRIEKSERRRFEQSKNDFIARFVEVLDNLDRAIDSIENAFDPDSVLQGIMLVRSRLVQLLKEEGLEKIFVRGQIFDPTHSEAAGMESVPEDTQDGVVLRELQPGYMLKGSLLRVARVVVGRFGSDAAASDPSEASTVARRPAAAPEPESAEAPSEETPAMESSGEKKGGWEADTSGDELELTENGLDFSDENNE